MWFDEERKWYKRIVNSLVKLVKKNYSNNEIREK